MQSRCHAVTLYVVINICDSGDLQRLAPSIGMEKYQHPLLDILFRAVLALVASALMLFVSFVLYMEFALPERADRPPPLEILGNSMEAVVGGGEVQGSQLVITAYHPKGGEHIAVAVWRGRLQAAAYQLLQYQFESASLSPQLQLVWRTASDPGIIHHADLNVTDSGTSWLNLASHPQWQGTVEELGVYVIADAAEQALSISHLTLEPLGWRAASARHWSDWTSWRGWSARSINYLSGTSDQSAPSPVPVAAAWSALAVGLLLLAGVCGGGWQPSALAATLLLPWISLDLLWQKELLTQLTQTREQFAEKTVQQKHLADVDGDIYRYIMRLKDGILPTEPSRLVIVHDSAGHNFDRLKAQYYLLPHNVYNFGRLPPATGVERIDYILILGDVPDLEFDPQTNNLVWQYGEATREAELLDSAAMGRLYRVLPQGPEAE